MAGSLLPKTISASDFQDALTRYPNYVPKGLEELDKFRFDELPDRVAQRQKERNKSGGLKPVLLMTKAELVKLVEWKLKHGTFRPKLLQLVQSNSEDLVHDIMTKIGQSDGGPKENMQSITQLKGVGPATASLVLSCIHPWGMPFFSDELFRWMHWDGKNADGTDKGIKAGKGWSRPIAYNQKEYESLREKCADIQMRHDLRPKEDKPLDFLKLEKVAYVLGKEKAEIDKGSPAAPETVTKKRGREDAGVHEDEKPKGTVKRNKSTREKPDKTTKQPERKSTRSRK